MAGAATHTVTEAFGGCFECALERKGDRSAALWTSRNALAVAARHHQATGHETWADVVMSHRYGGSSDGAD